MTNKYTKREKEIANRFVRATGGYPPALMGLVAVVQSMEGDDLLNKIECALTWLKARGFDEQGDVVKWWQQNWERVEPQIEMRSGVENLYHSRSQESRKHYIYLMLK